MQHWKNLHYGGRMIMKKIFDLIDFNKLLFYDKIYHNVYKNIKQTANDEGLTITDFKLFDKKVMYDAKANYIIFCCLIFFVSLIIIKLIWGIFL